MAGNMVGTLFILIRHLQTQFDGMRVCNIENIFDIKEFSFVFNLMLRS